MSLLINYTSNVNKLILNTDRLMEIKAGKFKPIAMHFSLTDECNLNCPFCSNKERLGQTFSFDEIKSILLIFKSMGAKAVEFTGGEPTLHPDINEIINYAKELKYSIGLKSNGIDIKKHLDTFTIQNLTWLRISLNSLNYVSEDKLDFSGISEHTFFGFSFVFNMIGDFLILKKLKKFKNKYNAKYVRLIADNSFDDLIINEMGEKIKSTGILNEPGFFWHEKNYGIPEKCWMMWLKPFINTDRNVYFCCATQMFEKKFSKLYKLCSTDPLDIASTWLNPHAFKGKMCNGLKCYYRYHNEMIQSMLEGCNHFEFI